MKSNSLWVKWVHTYIIKRKCLWHMKIPQDFSWTLRKLFNLRELGQPFIRHVIGNGNNTFLWLDYWHPQGPLYKVFGVTIVWNVVRSLLAKVSAILQNGEWHWPRRRNRSIMQLLNSPPVSFCPTLMLRIQLLGSLLAMVYIQLKLHGKPLNLPTVLFLGLS